MAERMVGPCGSFCLLDQEKHPLHTKGTTIIKLYTFLHELRKSRYVYTN